jgi:hypothetical protein
LKSKLQLPVQETGRADLRTSKEFPLIDAQTIGQIAAAVNLSQVNLSS